MQHSLPLISTLAIAFGLALIFGFLAERFKVPALVGYLLAGIMCGAHTPGPVADMELASQLSEIGVMLLMFGVGLHFSLSDLLRVKNIAVPGAVLQMTIATVLGALFAIEVWNWTFAQALVFGLCLSCASTVVLLKALELHGHLKTYDGQISVGWLVVEDIATVVILVLLPPVAQILAGGHGGVALSASETLWIVGFTLLRVVAFVVLMLVVGQKLIPWALIQVAKTGSRELFTLSILACAIGIAFGASVVFDVSFALGAFFAGMVLQESKYAHRAAKDSMPLQDAFSVLFFVGVGMMLDWHVLLTDPVAILCMLAIIIIGKGVTAFILVHALKYPLHTSLTVAAALAQIGEFSYILAAQGIALKMVDTHLMSMIVAASIFSIALNPFVFKAIPFVRKYLLRYFAWARAAAMITDRYSELPQETDRRFLSGQTILVGTCAVNDILSATLFRNHVPFVSIVENAEQAQAMRDKKLAVITGDPSDPMVLVQAHIITATLLVISGVDPVTALKIAETAKQLNPSLKIVIRAEQSALAEHLAEDQKVGEFVFDTDSVSDSLYRKILAHYATEEGDDDDNEDETAARAPAQAKT